MKKIYQMKKIIACRRRETFLMKVLLFTHKSDIDGMGNAVLAKIAFAEVDYVLCETYNLQNEILKFYDKGDIYNYDIIFVKDLWLEEPC